MLKDIGYVENAVLADGVDPVLALQDRIATLEEEVAQLRQALVNRQRYGVVTGVLAARYGISPDRAWQLVVRLSQHSNLKVQIIARVLYDRFFGQLAAEDEAIAARLDAQLSGQLRPLISGPVTRIVDGDRG